MVFVVKLINKNKQIGKKIRVVRSPDLNQMIRKPATIEVPIGNKRLMNPLRSSDLNQIICNIESFQDCGWDPEFPQLSQMVQSLPGFLNLCLNVCSKLTKVCPSS